MKIIKEKLPTQPEHWHQLITSYEKKLQLKEKETEKLEKKIVLLLTENEKLRFRLNKQLQQQFGIQSETANSLQLRLFNEADELDVEQVQEIAEADKQIHVAAYVRTPGGRKPLPKHFERITKIYDLPQEEKICACGCPLTKMNEIKSEQLSIIPIQVRVIEHVRYQYACKQCEQSIKLAECPQQPIPKSIATADLLAHILVSKFCDHLPLYRQEAILQRMGVDIARSTLCRWVIQCGEILKPLVTMMQKIMLKYDIGYTDETTVQVLKEPGRLATQKSFMWLFIGGTPEQRCFIYRYNTQRSHKIQRDFWQGFSGHLHTDGFSGYQVLFKDEAIPITGIHCWQHARRKFVEVVQQTKKEGLAHWAIKQISELYQLESWMKKEKFSTPIIYEYRQRKAKPLLNKFKKWLDENVNQVPPQSGIGQAILYCLKFWHNLIRYIDDGRFEIDNNRTERSIKPFVIGRKNWIFSDTIQGVEASSIIYSLIETCKEHRVELMLT